MMDKSLEIYLDKVDRYLKPMLASSRVDILNEIKNDMMQFETTNGMTSNDILEKLGDPKNLAKSYLADSICLNTSFKWNRFLMVVAFYSKAGFIGLFVLPFISVLSVSLMICSIMTLLGGLVKFIGYLLNIDVPFEVFQLGSYTLHPILLFPFSIVISVLLYIAGRSLWKKTIKTVQSLCIK